ncbi:LAMI_0B01662g1_1 [Lachancea mirantina]|uniref:LAMI_0B01662g1_1 n=1 Tax=Lachancea mirantina TaxID=1230905 RepID=A0A1G4IU18_9SACH|nr:LAMI_0B01662g1_1 [Lachancea mirantina]
MVELAEIKEDPRPFETEEEAQEVPAQHLKQEEDSSDEFSSDDEFDEEETMLERLYALKDIVPPKQRQTISRFFDFTASTIRSTFSKGGNLVWAVTTSALLLGVPLSLSILGEQQLIEMEKSFDLQKDANDILAQGETAQSPSPVAV